MVLTPECAICSIKQIQRNYSAFQPDEKKQMAFIREAMRMIADSPEDITSPEINGYIMAKIAKEAGKEDMFWEEKHRYNQAILEMEDKIWAHIQDADDKLYRALQYAMAGNYIDFGVPNGVSHEKLEELIESAVHFDLGEAYGRFREELDNAETVAYLHDNCGEIVFDKLCIAEIKALYPDLNLVSVVRGMPTYNDVTMADARDVGLTDVVPVIGNGAGIPGTALHLLSDEAKALVDSADIIISKGMGNLETLAGCGLNIYYLLLCKCERIRRYFGKELYASVFHPERSVGVTLL